ncbi:RNase H domain-containing protein [Trichonephila clavipes]|nr:RNase H domain-containing protein [Trichonephila clavipes]
MYPPPRDAGVYVMPLVVVAHLRSFSNAGQSPLIQTFQESLKVSSSSPDHGSKLGPLPKALVCDWRADSNTLRTTYISLVRPILEFGLPIYACASKSNLDKIERVQLSAARIITGFRLSYLNGIVLFESNQLSLYR